MGKFIEMSGRAFGGWSVRSYAGKGLWVCHCRCGAERLVSGKSLRRGGSKQCRECMQSAGLRRSHGGCGSRLYMIWAGMKARCLNKRHANYGHYGARGISVCDEWASDFAVFRDWAFTNGYGDTLTIDRKDNDLGYFPENCRWVTRAQQNQNRRNNRPVTYRGEPVLIPDLARRHGLPEHVVKDRIRRSGWSVEKAISTPVREPQS